MKKFLLLIVIIFFALIKAQAQYTQPSGLAFNFYSGYVFQNKIDALYNNQTGYNGEVYGGYQWGGGLEYILAKSYSVDITYLRQNTHTNINYVGESPPEINPHQDYYNSYYRSTFNYLMFGGNVYMNSRWDNLKPYGGLMIGMLINKDFQENGTLVNSKFAWGLKVGSNYMVSDNFMVKLQGSVMSAVQTASTDPSIGVGGTLNWYTDYRSLIQYSITAGISYLF